MMDVITKAEAARRLGVSRPRVHALLAKNRLQQVECDGKTMVLAASVNQRLANKNTTFGDATGNRVRVRHCTSCGVKLEKQNAYASIKGIYTQCKTCHQKRTRFSSYRSAAKARGLPFELTQATFEEMMRQACEYCGGMYYKGYNGIDRIDSDKGYVDGNMVACCKSCNMAKGNMPINEWRTWLKRIKAHRIPAWLENAS